MTTQRQIAIPEPTDNVAALWKTCMALREAVEILQGIRGNRAAVIQPDLAASVEEIVNDVVDISFIKRGTGSPEGVVYAGVGSIFLRRDGGAGTTLYVKESGTGNTGWVAK